jgi:hypothetical protein
MAEEGGVRSKENGSTEEAKDMSRCIPSDPGGVERPEVGVYGPKLESDEKLLALEGGYPITWLSSPNPSESLKSVFRVPTLKWVSSMLALVTLYCDV